MVRDLNRGAQFYRYGNWDLEGTGMPKSALSVFNMDGLRTNFEDSRSIKSSFHREPVLFTETRA
jgi:hypothetical protein